jgi:hypothetical protein
MACKNNDSIVTLISCRRTSLKRQLGLSPNSRVAAVCFSAATIPAGGSSSLTETEDGRTAEMKPDLRPAILPCYYLAAPDTYTTLCFE